MLEHVNIVDDQWVPLQVICWLPSLGIYPARQEYSVMLPFWYPSDIIRAFGISTGEGHIVSERHIKMKKKPNPKSLINENQLYFGQKINLFLILRHSVITGGQMLRYHYWCKGFL